MPELAPITAAVIPEPISGENVAPQSRKSEEREEEEEEEEVKREPLLSSAAAAATRSAAEETTEEDEESDEALRSGGTAEVAARAAEEGGEESDDLGKQLSPLGSNNSSVQDVAANGRPEEVNSDNAGQGRSSLTSSFYLPICFCYSLCKLLELDVVLHKHPFVC